MLSQAICHESRHCLVYENQGQKIFCVLHLPKSATKENPVPIVVTLHGFASHKVGTNRSTVILAEQLTQANIATLRFDFRGAGDSEGDSAELAFSDYLTDLSTVLKGLKGIKELDMSRVGLYGSSLGGAVAVLAAAQIGSIKALALWAPVASGQLWFADWLAANPGIASKDPREALASYRGIQLSKTFQEEFGQMSAVNALSKIPNIPLLHMHGQADKMISIRHQMAYQVARKGATAETIFESFPETDHVLGRQKIFFEVLAKCVHWFEGHL